MPPEKRRKLIGSGGHRIRGLINETGAELQTISEEHMSVFAPSREVMEDVMERVENILQEEEVEVRQRTLFSMILINSANNCFFVMHNLHV